MWNGRSLQSAPGRLFPEFGCCPPPNRMALLLTTSRRMPRITCRGLFGAAAVWAALAGASHGQTYLSNAQYDALQAQVQAVVIGASVCDVGLLPASARRPATIVAVVDFSGRLFCNSVVRVGQTEPPVLLQELPGWWVGYLDTADGPVVQDVNGDGEADLVVPAAVSDYEGDRTCVATVPFVYRCGAERCVDASAAAPAFYRALQQRLAARIRELEMLPAAAGRGDLPCLAMAAAKAERLQGANPRAGLRLAEQWMDEADPSRRRKAIWILADILAVTGDPDARARLEALARRGHDYAHVLLWLEQRHRQRPASPW